MAHSFLSPLPKLILFDADGTLFESEMLHHEANRRAAKELHDVEYSWEAFDKHVRRGTRTSYDLLTDMGVEVDPETFLAKRHEIYRDVLVQELVPMPGLINFLLWCEKQSIRRCIVSSSRRQMLETSLSAVGLDQFFEFVIAHEDMEDARRKPAPDPYLLGLDKTGVLAADAMAIEDTGKGITAARAAGLRCIAIRNQTNDEQEISIADLVINDYTDLLQ